MKTALIVPFILVASAACGAETAYSCVVPFPVQGMEAMDQVDQLVVDLERPSIEFRVAKTLGTTKPMVWRYDPSHGAEVDETVSIHVDGDFLKATAIGIGHSIAIAAMRDGQYFYASLGYIMPTATWALQFRCQR